MINDHSNFKLVGLRIILATLIGISLRLLNQVLMAVSATYPEVASWAVAVAAMVQFAFVELNKITMTGDSLSGAERRCLGA